MTQASYLTHFSPYFSFWKFFIPHLENHKARTIQDKFASNAQNLTGFQVSFVSFLREIILFGELRMTQEFKIGNQRISEKHGDSYQVANNTSMKSAEGGKDQVP